ncbi:MAG: SusC/RagA family TonB-linked outer membrane protein [Bacteroidales bacterium]
MKRILFLLTLILPITVFAQATKTVSGKVIDLETKETLIGATVFIDPKDGIALDYNPQGTVTDADGAFSFVLPKEVKHLLVSYIGYEVKKIDISKGSQFTVALESDSKQLQDVVVTGYQKIEKRKMTSAIQKVDMSEIAQTGVSSVHQLLEGQIAGVVSTATNGGPGAANKIRIRGTVSLNGSADPLWVIDGVPLEGNEAPKDLGKENIDNLTNVSIAGLNPEDIADITILKDAAATAIYGARAANGVIVVTTKRGKKGSLKVNVNAATFYTLRPDFSKLDLMNASQKVDFELGLAKRSDLDYKTNKGSISRILAKYGELDAYRQGGFGALSQSAQTEINNLRGSGIDWGQELYRPTLNQQYGVSISGGGDIANYYVSAGYYNEQGTTKGTGFDRFNLTSNTDFQISKKLKLNVGIFGSQSKRQTYITDTDAFTNPARYSRTVNPYAALYNADGSYAYDQDIEGYENRPLDYNFDEELSNTNYELNTTSLKGVFNFDYNVFSGLKLSAQFGLQYDKSSTEKFADKSTYFTRKFRESTRYKDKETNQFDYFLPDGGIIQNWNNDFMQYTFRTQADYSKRFNEIHDLDLMGGFEMRSNTATEIHTKGFGYDARTLTTKPLVFPEEITPATINNARYKQYQKNLNTNRFLSYYATASYTYDNRYTMFGSIRFDGSDLIGVDPRTRYLPLWSISGAWNANREEFLRNVSWLSNLKLRGSYGVQGNIDKNTSPLLLGEWGNTSLLPDNNESIITVLSPPNPRLRWERTSTTNVGLDFGVLNGRINLTAEGYWRNSTDLIGMRHIPGENGFIFTTMNWAAVSNKGFELSLSTVNIKTKDFTWATDFNFSRNISCVDDINIRDNSYEPSLKGYPVNAMFALKTAGLDENGLPMFEKDGKKMSAKEFFKIQEGDWGMIQTGLSHQEFRDLYTYMGDGDPKFTGGLVNKFRYKDFDLAISASFSLKQMVRETPFYDPVELDRGMNYPNKAMQIWTPDNPNGKYPALLGYSTTGGDANLIYQWYGMDAAKSYRNYDIWFKEISYLRINSIRLGYTLPQSILKDKFISSARFSFEARNPFVFGTSYKGFFDPETYGNIYAQPIPKSFSVGVNMTF